MTAFAHYLHDTSNPLDQVERLAERRRWPMDRTSEEEVVMAVTGGWCDLNLSLSWRDDLETLQTACAFEMKVPIRRHGEVMRLVCMINARLLHGHFDFWPEQGSLVFRNSLLLSDGAIANDGQCDAMIHSGLDNCQRYYPAFQFVIRCGKTAAEALENALLETQGEA